jgi:radical SAM protein with 4Fe4S-binding SPASM domain
MWDRIQAKHPFPLSVMFAPTERCNLLCKHCAVDDGAAGDELNLETIERILDDLAQCGVLSLTLTGGEPALRPDLEAIVDAAMRRRFWVRLKTNATLIDEKRVDGLLNSGLAGVNVSLYHPDPAKHNQFVDMEGAFEKAMDAMSRFSEAGIEVQASIVVMDWNANAIKPLIDECEQREFIYSVDVQVSPRHNGDCSPCNLRASEEMIGEIMSDQRLFDPVELVSRVPRAKDSPLCQAARSSAFIHANGDVMPCTRLNIPFGNITEEKFSTIWLQSEERKQLLSLRWGDLPLCCECEMSWICSRCPSL